MGAERFLADRLKHHGATDDRRKMLALAATVDDVINLGRGDPDLETPGYIMEAAKEGLDKQMTHYTAWAGLPELRRAVAKKAKDFAEADRIRDELKLQGIEITDVPDGAVWKRV